MKCFGEAYQALCLDWYVNDGRDVSAADVLFDSIPADCLFAVRINNLESSLDRWISTSPASRRSR